MEEIGHAPFPVLIHLKKNKKKETTRTDNSAFFKRIVVICLFFAKKNNFMFHKFLLQLVSIYKQRM